MKCAAVVVVERWLTRTINLSFAVHNFAVCGRDTPPHGSMRNDVQGILEDER